jgi:hypothetical protein
MEESEYISILTRDILGLKLQFLPKITYYTHGDVLDEFQYNMKKTLVYDENSGTVNTKHEIVSIYIKSGFRTLGKFNITRWKQ